MPETEPMRAPVSPAARTAVGVAGALVVVSALVAGVVAPVAGLLLLAVQAASCAVGYVDVPGAARRATAVLVAAAGVAAAVVAWNSAAEPLGVLACGAVVAQHLVLERRRDLRAGLLATAGTSLLVLAAGPVPASLAPLIGAWAAGVAAHALQRIDVHLVDVTRSTAAPGTTAQTLRRAVVPVGASVVAALVVGLLGLQPPSTTQQLGSLTGPTGSSAGQGQSRSAGSYAQGPVDLRSRGDLPRTPVLEVPSGSDRLWRSQYLTTYDGSTWTADGAPWPEQSGRDLMAVGDADPAGTAPLGPVRSDVLRVLAGRSVPVPGHVRGVYGLAVPRFAAPGALVLQGDVTEFAVESHAVPEARAVAGASGTGSDPGDPDEDVWTALPPTVSERTRALAREVSAGARSRAEVVAAVEDHLRGGGYEYDLDSPVPPAGQDAVDHFLFEARAGYCEQFASAEVVLLRSLGIPARMATGFSGGEDRGDGTRLVRADRAHAWVEVWQPGTGWTPSDPTPGADPSLTSWVQETLADRDVRRTLAVALVLAFVAALALVALLRRRAVPPVVPGRPASASPLVAAAERLLVALERTGHPLPPDRTLGLVARQVPEAARALALAERAAYGRVPPRGRAADDAVQELDRITARILAAARETADAKG